jgi:hypothetical protein
LISDGFSGVGDAWEILANVRKSWPAWFVRSETLPYVQAGGTLGRYSLLVVLLMWHLWWPLLLGRNIADVVMTSL